MLDTRLAGFGNQIMNKSLLRKLTNRLLHMLARTMPGSTNLRIFLHRLRGVRIKGTIFIGDDVYLENEYPERIEIHDNARIGLRTTIISHFKGPGKVIIEKDAWIGPCCTIVSAGGQVRTIGEGSVVSAGSVVNQDVPPYTFVSGVPAQPVSRITVPIVSADSVEDFTKGLRPLR